MKIKTYLMKDLSTGYYKIGKSVNPEFREKTLQSEKPSIELISSCDIDIESKLHLRYDIKRVRGEWFNLTDYDVAFIEEGFLLANKGMLGEYFDRNIEIPLETPLLNLTVGQLISIIEIAIDSNISKLIQQSNLSTPQEKKYYYGYDGLAEILGCSRANAANVKLSGLLDGAFTQIGRKIIWDREKVLELAGRKKGGRK